MSPRERQFNIYPPAVSIENINVDEAIKRIKNLMQMENMSLAMRTAIETILLLVQILINRLGTNSTNSGTPPSQDPNRKKKPKKETGKKQGGQKGHKGKTLSQVDNPDEVVPLSIDKRTLPKGEYTQGKEVVRQVFDIEIRTVITEYRAEVLVDKYGTRFIAKFPEDVKSHVQYGNGVKAHAVYLSQYQLMPYERMQEYLSDHFSLPISPGSIANWNREAYEKLEIFEQNLRQKLINSERVHGDESGVNVNGKGWWVHVNSDDYWTLLYLHKKRGKEAMDEGILPHYKGFCCHDGYRSYYIYKDLIDCLCNEHHKRELENVCDTEENHQWAEELQKFLLDLNEKVNTAGGALNEKDQQQQRKIYREILAKGEKECPPPPEKKPDKNGKKKRGRLKRSKARNLLERLLEREDEVLRFMTHKNIPFTNNLGERDLRMIKVQQKISGCFRSEEGGMIFCRIRSYLGSAKKQNFSPHFAILSLFEGKQIFENLDGAE